VSKLINISSKTAINFGHVNGRSLYIVDWRMVVVEGGNVLHRVKRKGNYTGGENVRGIYGEEYVQGENVRIAMFNQSS